MPWNDPVRRRSIRMPWHDYSSGRYFLTMVVHERALLFGDIVNTSMHLSDVGTMCERWWNNLPERYPAASLDAYVIMPDHMHAILELRGSPSTLR